MFSTRTCNGLISIVEQWNASLVDRFLINMEISQPVTSDGINVSRQKKANFVLSTILQDFEKQKLAFQLILDQFLMENQKEVISVDPFDVVESKEEISIDDLFAEKYPFLMNSLKMDGFTVKNKKLVNLLPEELVQSDTENELYRLLEKYGFSVSRGHLDQAVSNHGQGLWAAANAQFRTFFESLLVELSNKLIPTRTCSNCGEAIQWLSDESLHSPALFSTKLNEVAESSAKSDKTYVAGLWKRLHPEGSHPGLSDEEDSTFRYHTLVVFVRYILKRLEERGE